MNMTISADGILGRAAAQCKRSRDNKHLEWPLLQLLKHLKEVKSRKDDPKILDEFFRVWVFEDE